MNQLILPYQKNIQRTFDSFFSDNDKNLQIVDSLKNIFDRENSQTYLWGQKYSGKSHLLYSACNYYSKKNKKCVYLPLKEKNMFGDDILNSFADYDLICIDDIDEIFGINNWEYSFFVLINKILEKSKKIIFTSSSSLALNKINLKDLQSRISWGLIYMIENPNENIKKSIINKIVSENDYNISTNVIDYLLNNKERDTFLLLENIHKIGRYSLSINKKISVRDLKLIIN